uniref:Uncharacterized protein n=1 Tax=Chrysemys picta bellii TaxID=8478 RepID=A0A8C3IX78_CHRPI
GSILQPESMSGDKVLLKIPTPNSPLNYISMNHLLSSTFWVPHPTLAAQVLPVAPQATALCPGPFAINFLFGSFLSTIIIIRISFPITWHFTTLLHCSLGGRESPWQELDENIYLQKLVFCQDF